jgi:hypothetical protein
MGGRAELGTVEGLWRYPVKSLAAQELQSSYVDERGLAGDRRSALFVTTPGTPRSGKTLRGKEQPRFHTAPNAGIARKYASSLDLELREDGPYFDARPVSLIFDRWLRELEDLTGMHVEALRFRPNVLVRARGAVSPEAEFVGSKLRVGSAIFHVIEPIVRCVTVSYDLETAVSSTELLRALVHVRNNVLGLYCTVEQPGALAAGDLVHRIE